MIRLALAAVLLAVPTAAFADGEGSSPQRVRSVTLTGGQACPPSTGDEIIVCNRIDEPYRIPKALRDSGPIAPQNQSWVNRTQSMEQTQREAGGLPDTCTAVGTGGQTGCFRKSARAYAAGLRALPSGQLPTAGTGSGDDRDVTTSGSTTPDTTAGGAP